MKQNFKQYNFTLLPILLFLLIFGSLTEIKAQNSANIFGVTGNQLVRFNASAPGTLTTVGTITGLQANENILGIDFRPATGQLYALGSTSRLYVIDKTTGVATQIGAPFTPALIGTNFGFDFNPTVDRIRIVSNSGQNLRANPNDGTVINDGAINPATFQPTAAAYTNNFAGATTTTLYDIDAATDQLLIQNPANSGTISVVGPLGVDFTDLNGFDFFSGSNTAYAVSSNMLGTPQLFTINLTTGAATLIGAVGGSTNLLPLRGIAVETGAPATAGFRIFALTTANQLVRLNSNRANAPIGNAITITGLQANENILGIDFRPATGELFGLGSTSRLYRINIINGAATPVGAAGAFTLIGTTFGFDFNPTVDRIRVISDTGQNLRLNPNDGTLSATDSPLNGGATGADAAAYTNSFNGAMTTTLYDISSLTDTLYRQDPPNNGTLVTIGTLGLNVTGVNGFDIATSNNVGLAALQVNNGTASGLYTINLTTGIASFVSPINTTMAIRGLAITAGSAATNTLDFNGDRRADYAFFRPSNGIVYISRPDNTVTNFQFGATGDIITPGDYDGDGISDYAVFRPSNGVFYIRYGADGTFGAFQFGQSGDEPVARDYDGDGRTDFAVVRRVNGVLIWFIYNSSTNTATGVQFGAATDKVAPGDYDGDGRFDLAVYRGTGTQPATFFVQRSTAGFTAFQFGIGSDTVVPGDYDGDGRTDYAVLRSVNSVYQWYILRSSDNTLFVAALGADGNLPVQNDYDGDGRTDIAVYNTATGVYSVRRSLDGVVSQFQFGQNGDIPAGNYDAR